MNVKLLRKVAKHIVEEPRRFAMGTWLFKAKPGSLIEEPDNDELAKRRVPACGTVACIAGWATQLGDYKGKAEIHNAARRLLELSPLKANSLFFLNQWPSQFFERWHATDSKSAHAKIAAERINHFIKTGN